MFHFSLVVSLNSSDPTLKSLPQKSAGPNILEYKETKLRLSQILN